MNMRRAQPQEVGELREWLKANHYLRATPPGQIAILEFSEARKRIGAVLLGRPTSRAYNADLIMEVARIYFVDDTAPNVESKALGMTRKFVRTWYPKIKLLISYSDLSQGHCGGIYLADGWAPLGVTNHTKGYGWRSRSGRRDDPVGRKQRWVRTP